MAISNATLTAINKELAELQTIRDQKSAALYEAQAEAAASKAAFGGGIRLPAERYKFLCQQRLDATRKVYAAQKELLEINAKIRATNQQRTEAEALAYKAIRSRGRLDEFDLHNALSEPQNLLRRCVARMEKLLSRCGYEHGDRELVESCQDYMRRHGITV